MPLNLICYPYDSIKMSIGNVKKALIVKIKNEGLIKLLKDMVYYVLFFILSYRRYSILSRSVFKPIPDINIRNHITTRIAMYSDLPKFEIIVTPMALENFSKRLKEGKICLIALDGDKIIYYSWISFVQEGFIRIKDEEAYFFNSFTSPKYRNMGIHTKMTIERLRLIKQMGYEKALLIILPKNLAAKRALKKIGFEESGWASDLCISLLKIHYYVVTRKERGEVVGQYRSFSCNWVDLRI